jgi:hypothetical protein
MPHRAEAPYHRALQVGWSRFRAVLMLMSAYPQTASGVNGTKVISNRLQHQSDAGFVRGQLQQEHARCE